MYPDAHPDIPFTDFEILFLGTSAGSPSVRRNPSSICLRLSQHNWMFDCAEASLRQLMKSTIRVPMTNKFFITHLHGDHLYGLPGILCTLDNHHNNGTPGTNNRCEIAVYGPVGLYAYLTTALSTSRTRLNNLQVTVYELALKKIPEQTSAFEKYMRNIPKHPVRSRSNKQQVSKSDISLLRRYVKSSSMRIMKVNQYGRSMMMAMCM